MVRYGRRKIGRSFFHKRYFVLECLILAYYKKQPSANEVNNPSIASLSWLIMASVEYDYHSTACRFLDSFWSLCHAKQ